MQKKAIALILMVLGIIVLAFPLLGLIPLSVITGFLVLILGIGLLISGLMELEIGESTSVGLLELVLGIIALVLGIGFIFNPGLFSWLAGFIVWIVGLFLIISGIVGVIVNTGGYKWSGVISIVIGLIYLVVGILIANPIILGILIGAWLLIYGILMLLVKD